MIPVAEWREQKGITLAGFFRGWAGKDEPVVYAGGSRVE